MELAYKTDAIEEQRQHDYEVLLDEICEEFGVCDSHASKMLYSMVYSDYADEYVYSHRIEYARALVDAYHKRIK